MPFQTKGFADWVLRRREAAGFTQEELAARAGCQKAYISKLEKTSPYPIGQKPPAPTLEFLAKLARALGANITEPLMALGYLKEERPAEPHIVRLLHYYRELSPREQRIAEEIIKTLWRERESAQKSQELNPKKRRA